MRGEFQRLLMMSEPEILPLNAQAALGPPRPPQRTQFGHLYRHFLERFFNDETASPDGDAKTRMVQVACAAGLPGFCVALYLFSVYHPFPNWPPGSTAIGPPPYWVQVAHHFFFVIYAFVSMGIATVFEWDMFFPDLLDVLVLGSLPIGEWRLFRARIAAIGMFIGGFLLVANIVAPLVLPSTTEPDNLTRFLLGHLAAVFMSALFAAAFVLAVQGSLLAILGERWFRRVSLALQGTSIAALLILLLLFPFFSGVTSAVLRSGGAPALWFPPFWFLGIYQRLLEGPQALPIFGTLAQIGCAATAAAILIAVIAYPIAYHRKVRQLIEGASTRTVGLRATLPLDWLLHFTVLRPAVRRAVFHFISRTILRVPRYRIYLVIYGGVGLSVVVASVLRFSSSGNLIHITISADGVRAVAGIVAFWTIAGLRMAFVSSGNQRGSWIFHFAHGRPAHFRAAIEQFKAAKVYAFLVASLLTVSTCVALLSVSPLELRTLPALASQLLIAIGLCVLLTDAFFLNVTITAFTGEPERGHSNLALTVLKYYAFFPFVTWLPVFCEPFIEESRRNFFIAAEAVILAHLIFNLAHRRIVREYSNRQPSEDGVDDEYQRLGLRN